MALNLGLGFYVDDRALGVGALLATSHGDVGALQVIQRKRIGRVVTKMGANLVKGKLCRILELVIPKAESSIQHARQHRQQLLLLLGHHIPAGVLSKNVSQVGQCCHQVGFRTLLICARLLGCVLCLIARSMRLPPRQQRLQPTTRQIRLHCGLAGDRLLYPAGVRELVGANWSFAQLLVNHQNGCAVRAGSIQAGDQVAVLTN